MTIELNTMLDLRDLQVAMDVAKRAEIGWFDVEFTMYGCGYLEKGKRYYRISAQGEKIYNFIENAAVKNILPTDIIKLTKVYPVPAGMREIIAYEVKRDLAKQIDEQFSKEFFRYLQETAELAADDSGWEILKNEWQKIEGCFDRKMLKRFQELTIFAYNCRKITLEQYWASNRWAEEEFKSMQEDLISKDRFEKTFYGIAYRSRDTIKYEDNARQEHVYGRKYTLEKQGVFVTPIFAETYWYNYDSRPAQIHALFEQRFQQAVNDDYLRLLEKISRHNYRISREEFAQKEEIVLNRFGQLAAETFRHYGQRWGIIL